MKKTYYYETGNTELKNILSDYMKKAGIYYELSAKYQDYFFTIWTDEETAKKIETLINIIINAQERTKAK